MKFIYLALKNINIVIFYLLISLLTMYQRIIFKDHNILQLLVGAVVGILFAYFIYYMAQQKIVGKIRAKKDDNAPI